MELSLSIFIALGICYIIEQVFYLMLGSYPYRYGFTVYKILLPNFDIDYWDSIKRKTKTLSIKTRVDIEEVYFKYRYPSLTLGPSLFVGRIIGVDGRGVLQIKVGPLSALFAVYLIAYPFISNEAFADVMFSFLNILLVAALFAYLFIRLLNQIYGLVVWKNQ